LPQGGEFVGRRSGKCCDFVQVSAHGEILRIARDDQRRTFGLQLLNR